MISLISVLLLLPCYFYNYFVFMVKITWFLKTVESDSSNWEKGESDTKFIPPTMSIISYLFIFIIFWSIKTLYFCLFIIIISNVEYYSLIENYHIYYIYIIIFFSNSILILSFIWRIVGSRMDKIWFWIYI